MPTPSILYLKPAAPAAIVRDPITRKPLAQEGEDKPRNVFWVRRLNAGDVVEAPRPKAPKPPPGTTAKES